MKIYKIVFGVLILFLVFTLLATSNNEPKQQTDSAKKQQTDLKTISLSQAISHTKKAFNSINRTIKKNIHTLKKEYQQNRKKQRLSFILKKLTAKGINSTTAKNYLSHKQIRFQPELIAVNLGILDDLKPLLKKIYKEKQFYHRNVGLSQTEFLNRHRSFLKKVSEQYKIPQQIILSILQVETRLGAYTGEFSVLNVYYNLSLLKHPVVLNEVLARIQTNYPKQDINRLKDKAIKKAQWGLTELAALISLSGKIKQNLNTLYGSYAGAFGISQFIPSSYLYFSKDGDGNGIIDLFNMQDAVISTAHYLSKMGWAKYKHNQQKAILAYNHSSKYLKKVVRQSEKIKKEFPFLEAKKSAGSQQKQKLKNDISKMMMLNNK